jgi:hypothetical protein
MRKLQSGASSSWAILKQWFKAKAGNLTLLSLSCHKLLALCDWPTAGIQTREGHSLTVAFMTLLARAWGSSASSSLSLQLASLPLTWLSSLPLPWIPPLPSPRGVCPAGSCLPSVQKGLSLLLPHSGTFATNSPLGPPIKAAFPSLGLQPQLRHRSRAAEPSTGSQGCRAPPAPDSAWFCRRLKS